MSIAVKKGIDNKSNVNSSKKIFDHNKVKYKSIRV